MATAIENNMAFGTLKLLVTMGGETHGVEGASYAIKDKGGNVLFNGVTNENGESGVYTLGAPDKGLTLAPAPNTHPYGTYDVWVGKPGFLSKNIYDVEIFDGIQSVLPVDLEPAAYGDDGEQDIYIPAPTADMPSYNNTPQGIPPAQNTATVNDQNSVFDDGMMPLGRESEMAGISPLDTRLPLETVAIPDYISVKLGRFSDSSAPIVRVRFIDYIKNVASSEIYPTWPTNALIANIHAIVTFTLNRIYTEWYRSRGYNFDITNNTANDQAFVNGRNIYANISEIVDGIFNVYARRIGFRNPYFTSYCNGTTSTCNGLSQWGTVTLANRGLTPLQILRNYYGNDIELATAPGGGVVESYPGVALQLGSTGSSVAALQRRLNRISGDYPGITQIQNPNGTFDAQTQAAVRAFQRIFNLTQDGIVGRSTWNRISQIYSGVTSLADLGGEGERIGLSPTAPTTTVRQGALGGDVAHIQFLLNYISRFHPEVPSVIADSRFGASTTAAVRAFQSRFGLTADGVVSPNTWRRMYEVASGIIGQQPPTQPVPPIVPPTTPPQTTFPPFPGTVLRQGSTGQNVRTLQEMLNNARRVYSAIPQLTVDGNFGPITNNAVRTFQLYNGLTVDGIVGPITWNALRNI